MENKIKFPQIRVFVEDAVFISQVCVKCCGVFVPDYTYCYRHDGTSVQTSKLSPQKIRDNCNTVLLLRNALKYSSDLSYQQGVNKLINSNERYTIFSALHQPLKIKKELLKYIKNQIGRVSIDGSIKHKFILFAYNNMLNLLCLF